MSVVQDRFPKRTIEHVTLPEERPERRGLDRGSVGARADLWQLPAAGPDPGTARPDANPQATDPGDRTAHTTPAEDVRGREREADPRDHRHPGRQRSGDPDGAHPEGESREDASSVLDIADRDLPDCPSARNALRFQSDTDAQELWGQGPLADVNCAPHVRGYFVLRQGIATSAEGRILIGARCGVWAGYGPAPRQWPVESTEHHDSCVADAAQDVG